MRALTRTRVRDDAGIAVVWAAALTTMLVLAAFVVASVGSVIAARAKAASVADLAAIAAVQGSGCDTASWIAHANGVHLMSCEVRGSEVVVGVTAPPPLLLQRVTQLLGQPTPAISVVARASAG